MVGEKKGNQYRGIAACSAISGPVTVNSGLTKMMSEISPRQRFLSGLALLNTL